MNNKLLQYALIFVGILLASVLVIWGIWKITWDAGAPAPDKTEVSANVTALAQCLADKKVTMYGAYWCSHCQSQKKLFGDSFKYIPYVECTENDGKVCIAKGIQGFPTWLVPDANGKETPYEGEQSFEALSKASGCPFSTGSK